MHKTLLFVGLTFQLAVAQPALVFMQERDGSKQVMTCQADGSGAKALTQGKEWHLYPDVSADGQTLVWSQGPDEKNLGIMLRGHNTERWLVPPQGRNLHARMARSGQLLAFSGPLGPKGEARIGLLDPREEKPTIRTLESDHEAYFPAPSSDGAFLIYQSKERVLYKRDLPDGKPVRLTEGMSPSLSCDDREVAFTRQVDGNWDVYVLNLQTNETRRATTSPKRELGPAFLPDGTLVYCTEEEEGHFQLRGAVELDDPGSLYAPRATGDLSLRQAQEPPIPGPPRSSFGATRRDADVFLVGGHQGHEHTYPPESFVDRLDRFDAGAWQAKHPRPVAAHGFSVVADGNYVYAFGGFAYSAEHKPGWKSLARIDRYDIAHDRWEEVGKLPRPRSSNVAVRKGDLVYLIGGWDSTPRHSGDVDGVFHKEIDVFDLKTGKCTTLDAQLPDPLRRAFSGCLLGDRIILAGGIGVGGRRFALLDKVTAFDPESGRFEELPPLPFPTFAPALGALGDQLIVMGGMFRTSPQEYRYVNHIFRLGEKAWAHTGRYLSESKGFAQVVGLQDGSLGILGGHTYRADGTDSPVATFETLSLVGGPKKLSVEP